MGKDRCHSMMSTQNMHHIEIFAKRASLLAERYFTERYFGVKALTLHFV